MESTQKKKIVLRFLLAFALTLALTVSAAAGNWDDFRITRDLQDRTIHYNERFTLSVEVNVPEGAQVEYQWYVWEQLMGNEEESPIKKRNGIRAAFCSRRFLLSADLFFKL